MMKLVVFCYVVAAVAANAPVYFSPGAISSPLGIGYPVPQLHPFYNYRGPLSLAPGQPANILAADGRPLDTLAVNLDRSANFVAQALENRPRLLKKRSVTRLAVAPGPVGYSAAVAAGNVGIFAPFPFGPAATIATNPIGLSAPLAATGIINPFAAGPFGFSGPVATGPLAVSAPVAAGPLAVSTPITAGSTPLAPIASGLNF